MRQRAYMQKNPLALRMGHAEYARRRKIEAARIVDYGRPLSPRLTALMMRIGQPILTAGLRLSGLYRHGHHQFQQIRVRTHELRLPHLPAPLDGFTILHLSDLHVDLHPALVPALAEVLPGLRYDLCVITGDFRNSTAGPWEPAVTGTVAVCRLLTAPVYGVLGNHDTADMIAPLETAGLRFLLNESVVLHHAGARLFLIGIDDPNIYRTDNLRRALRKVPPRDFKVLLSHSPAIHRQAREAGVDLLLAGHTHGGQICLPGGVILVRNDPSPRALLHGIWQRGDLRGHTSAGTGSCGLPVRINCPPEASLLVLRPAAANRGAPP